jgi:tRNA (cmo5U34)-methyltransferase
MKNKRRNAAAPSPAPLKRWIPKEWTFNSSAVADRFDKHVREQLPWYDQLLACIAHIGAHYIGRGGIVYDVGASTGNVGQVLARTLFDRGACLSAIEQSREMASRWRPPMTKEGHASHTMEVADALAYTFEPFDFAVVNLVMMFMPIERREDFVAALCAKAKPGAAVVFVEKTIGASGYPGTVLRRMAMRWKLDAGVRPEEIVDKELSLGGVQRPIDPSIIPANAVEFFRFGEFVGWLWEAPEGSVSTPHHP